MNKKLRQKAIDSYLSKDKDIDWSGLMLYAQALLNSRDEITKNIKSPFVFDEKKAHQAYKEGKPYLKTAFIKINPKEFRDTCAKLVALYVQDGILQDPEQIKFLENIDWNALTDMTISMATVDLNIFYMSVLKELVKDPLDEDSLALLGGVLVNVVRAYLSPLGEGMTRILTRKDAVASSDSPLACPVCGSQASLSAVKENAQYKTGTRELFCACCGTAWPFERIRCGICGQTNPDKLKFVSADEDQSHRLHVCSACGGVLPTVFQDTLKAPLDYDVETVASNLVLTLYKQSLEQSSSSDNDTEA